MNDPNYKTLGGRLPFVFALLITLDFVSPTSSSFTWTGAAFVQADDKSSAVRFRVRETAGIRRFGYPVTLKLSVPPGQLKDSRHARLVNADHKSIPAQFSTIQKHSDESISRLEVDFNLSPGPLETVDLTLEYGDNVTSVEPKQVLTFAETDETFQVSAYTIRKDAKPLISSVRYGREYLQGDGLQVMAWDGDVAYKLESAQRQWTVEKKGPFQVRLRCVGNYSSRSNNEEIPYVLTLEFVSTKSWVGIRHSIPAKSAGPLSLGIAGDFQLTGRLLWDTDVGYWLYGVLESPEQMTFSQKAEGWTCELGKPNAETMYAASAPPKQISRGWGHFQESRENGNVIAFGFSGPSMNADYSYTLAGDGKLRFRMNTVKAISKENTAGELNAFFHFIPVPAQHTARTSPAAMMAPLEVTVLAQQR